jgi:cytochrome c oxidase subunit IV
MSEIDWEDMSDEGQVMENELSLSSQMQDLPSVRSYLLFWKHLIQQNTTNVLLEWFSIQRSGYMKNWLLVIC